VRSRHVQCEEKSATTAQIADTVTYEGTTHSLIGVSGEGLFDPSAHGLGPASVTTACWRGYVCQYGIQESMILLTGLSICLREEAQYPEIGGRKPSFSDDFLGGAVYEYLDIPMGFSGGLLLGRDFIQELYVHMGFQKPHAYREVKEVLFSDGRVLGVRDHSGRMQQLREDIRSDAKKRKASGMPETQGPPSRDAIAELVEHAFDLDYRSWSVFQEAREASQDRGSEAEHRETLTSGSVGLVTRLKRFLTAWRS
jgi:hypothetical protein